jgi:DNA polymerase-3 subunit beta
MHFVISQNSFSQTLNEVKNAVATRPTHPILGNVRLDADAKKQLLTLTAFDLNLAIQIDVPAQVVFDGSITVAHKLISDITSRLPDEDVTFTINDACMIDLSCGSGKYQLHGLPVDEFPELPKLDSEKSNTELSPNLLLKGLSATLFATSEDETKRILTGVHFTVKDAIEFAATDGHRLSIFTKDIEGEHTELALTIPSKSLSEIEKLCKTTKEELSLTFDHANVIFSTSSKVVISRLLDGTYPSYRQLIPSKFEHQVTLERKLFVSALERIAVIADQKHNIVKLTISTTDQSVALSVESADVATGLEEVPSQIAGEDIEIAFNIKYMLVINTLPISYKQVFIIETKE